uniref:LAGLIDADG homing endonuclease n=1 Tax=Ditylenchus dipsaci TaxID=166011 RepID=A0A915E4M2_9BILA
MMMMDTGLHQSSAVFNQLKFNTLMGLCRLVRDRRSEVYRCTLRPFGKRASVYHASLRSFQRLVQESEHHPSRSLFSIRCNFHTYNFLIRDRPKLSAPDKVQIHRESKSIARVPLVRIPISKYIPPSLHIVQGLAQNIISWIEKANPNQISALEDVYKSLGAQKQAWYQFFYWQSCAKYAVNEKCGAFEELLTLLGQIQSMAKSTFLSNEQVIMLGKLTHGFFLCLRVKLFKFSVVTFP